MACYSRVLAVLAFLLSLTIGNAIAEVPQLINYQGMLTDSEGGPVEDGEYPIQFKIWNDSTGGLLKWTSQPETVLVINGLFNYQPGSEETIPLSVFSEANLWLAITVETGPEAPEIVPRTRLVSSPFAFKAASSDNAAHADSTDAITDGGVDFGDIGQNGATAGQIMKWDGAAWVPASDETGAGPAGWVDDGDVVRLETSDDSVGIGTNTPSEKLDVVGNIRASGIISSGSSITIDGFNDAITATSGAIDFVDENLFTTGKVTIGPGHSNTGSNAFIAGENNTASGDHSVISGGYENEATLNGSTIGGGIDNLASGQSSTVSGGQSNTASALGATVGGGANNYSAEYSTVSGGAQNIASAHRSTIGGGHYNRARGQYATVGGGGGPIPVDSNSAYADFSTVGGGTQNIAGGDSSTVCGGKNNSATGINSTICGGNHNIAAQYANLVVGGQHNTADWHVATVVGGSYNKAIGGHTFVGAGERNEASGDWSTIGGGSFNRTRGLYSVVAGGGGSLGADSNAAIGDYSSIGGGRQNIASGVGTSISGGEYNSATNNLGVIGGGYGNQATGEHTTIGGGLYNSVSGDTSAICGGNNNNVSGYSSVIGGGTGNSASKGWNVVSGGEQNSAGGQSAYDFGWNTIGGGYNNQINTNGMYATISGGAYNQAKTGYGSIGGGYGNIVYETSNPGTISGGKNNKVYGEGATVGGGGYNKARGFWSVVGGGGGPSGFESDSNSAIGDFSTISGGTRNITEGDSSTVSGGAGNKANGTNATVSGGIWNTASGGGATISGGGGNTATQVGATVGGGGDNHATNEYATIGGGGNNIASGLRATIPGGSVNIAGGEYSFAAGLRAEASHNGSFVWADAINAVHASQRNNQFRIRANGGARFDVNGGWVEIYNDATDLITTSTGAHLTLGGDWTNSSDRNIKENYRSIDGTDILNRISRLPINRWNYKSENQNVTHIGPVAQDFNAVFEVGGDDKSISTVDPSGVALAGIKELIKQNDELKIIIEQLEKRIEQLESGEIASGGDI